MLSIVGLVGEGSFGRVYKCVNPQGKFVAMKTVRCKSYGIECLNEANVMLRFNHPHINRASDVYIKDDNLVIVQDLACYDLMKWRSNSKRVIMERMKYIFYQITHALHVLHAYDIVHCDVKAENVLVFSNDEVKLADFGLSRTYSQPFTARIATDTHRPPESWNNEECTKSVDIWCLGCTFYEVVTGVVLFRGWKDVLNYIATGKFRLSQHPCFNELVALTIAVDPSSRPTTEDIMASQFFDDIERPEIVYSVKSQLSPGTDVVSHFCKTVSASSSESLLKHATGLYVRVRDSGVNKELLKYTCLLIMAKVYCRKVDMLNCLYTLEELKNAERKVCEFVKFLVHVC